MINKIGLAKLLTLKILLNISFTVTYLLENSNYSLGKQNFIEKEIYPKLSHYYTRLSGFINLNNSQNFRRF